MLVLAETNFVLELAFARDAYAACQRIVRLAEERALTLAVPAIAIVEPYFALVGRHRRRRALHQDLQSEINDLRRSAGYASLGGAAREALGILIESTERENTSLNEVLARVLSVAELVSVRVSEIEAAVGYQARFGLEPIDSVVLASVVSRLSDLGDDVRFFLNKDAKDFLDPDIQHLLENLGCELVTDFATGLERIEAALRRSS